MPRLVWNHRRSYKTEHCCPWQRCKLEDIIHLPESCSFIFPVFHSSTYRHKFSSQGNWQVVLRPHPVVTVQLYPMWVKHSLYRLLQQSHKLPPLLYLLQNWKDLMCWLAVCGVSGNRADCSAGRGCACCGARTQTTCVAHVPPSCSTKLPCHGTKCIPCRKTSSLVVSDLTVSHCWINLKHCWYRHEPWGGQFLVWYLPSC